MAGLVQHGIQNQHRAQTQPQASRKKFQVNGGNDRNDNNNPGTDKGSGFPYHGNGGNQRRGNGNPGGNPNSNRGETNGNSGRGGGNHGEGGPGGGGGNPGGGKGGNLGETGGENPGPNRGGTNGNPGGGDGHGGEGGGNPGPGGGNPDQNYDHINYNPPISKPLTLYKRSPLPTSVKWSNSVDFKDFYNDFTAHIGQQLHL